MCRSIKVLRRPAEPATKEEMSAAALQFVRKVSGYRKPSQKNERAFDRAVAEVAESVERLLENLAAPETPKPSRARQQEVRDPSEARDS